MNQKITIIPTGGTIDESYTMENSNLFLGKKSQIEDMLKKSRVEKDTYHIIDKCCKFSEEWTEEDINNIQQLCNSSETSNKIILIMGTDRLIQLTNKLSVPKNKTIVATGAMIPFIMPNSDALFNLGAAIAFVQVLPIGKSYVCFHGKYWTTDNVEKDRTIFYFKNKVKQEEENEKERLIHIRRQINRGLQKK